MSKDEIEHFLAKVSDDDRQTCDVAIKSVIRKASELKSRHENSLTRSVARARLSSIADHSRELAKAIRLENSDSLITEELLSFGMEKNELAKRLDGLAIGALRRAEKVSSGKGQTTFSDEIGWPKPRVLIATFVILLLHRLRGKAPGKENKEAIDLCDAIWTQIILTSPKGKTPERSDDSLGWTGTIKTASMDIKSCKNVESARERWGKSPNLNTACLQPLPSDLTRGFNAWIIATDILRERALLPLADAF